MIIGSNSENKEIEKRVAITPEIIKKYLNLGFEIHLAKDYASHLGFDDSLFSQAGAKIINAENEMVATVVAPRIERDPVLTSSGDDSETSEEDSEEPTPEE